MAENKDQPSTSSSNSDVPQPEQMEVCAVCLESFVYPTELPCKHTFCFLCVKGLSRTTGCCAMCRQRFPEELLNNPSLKEPLNEALTTAFQDGHQWFYEGRNGWWQYDERTGQEIENAYTRREATFEVLIAGRIYVIDFENMVQFQKSIPIFTRRIKRDVATIPDKKGLSGIRLPGKSAQDDPPSEDQSTSTNVDQDGGIVSQTSTSDTDYLDDLINQTSFMNLDD